MSLFRNSTIVAAVICSFAINTSQAAPAQASIMSFLKHHVFSGQVFHLHKQNKQGKARVVSHNHLSKKNYGHVSPDKVVSTNNGASAGQALFPDAPSMPAPDLSSQPMPPLQTMTPQTDQANNALQGIAHYHHKRLLRPAAAESFTGLQAADSKDSAFATRASWYGPGFNGKRTASGARYNQEGLTAASRTLPFGSRVLVANPKTGRCCTVTINDRGPYVTGRDIDLSHGAAGKIGMTGVAPVVCVQYASAKSFSDGSPDKVTGRVQHLVAGVLP